MYQCFRSHKTAQITNFTLTLLDSKDNQPKDYMFESLQGSKTCLLTCIKRYLKVN